MKSNNNNDNNYEDKDNIDNDYEDKDNNGNEEESDNNGNDSGNSNSENNVCWCFDEVSEYNPRVIKLDLDTPVKF